MPRITIPLIGVLTLQIVVVIAAFVAVIAILTVQQQAQFQDSLEKQLRLQQGSAASDIVAPLTEREKQFDLLIQMYTEHSIKGGEAGTGANYLVPSERSTFVHFGAFHKHFVSMMEMDELVYSIVLSNQSAPYNSATGFAKWNMWIFEASTFMVIYNESIRPCPLAYVPGYANYTQKTPDVLYLTCAALQDSIPPIPQATGPIVGYEGGFDTQWTKPSTIVDPIHGTTVHSIMYTRVINPNRVPQSLGKQQAMLTVQTKHFKPVIVGASPTEVSVSALFVLDLRSYANHDEMHMVTGKVDFNDTITSSSSSTTNTWVGGKTPNPVLNSVFNEGRAYCYAEGNLLQSAVNPCEEAHIFELKDGAGNKYTCSAIRIVDARTKRDWLLVQYTPREEFFGENDRSRTVGIVIGAVGAVIVIVACVLIWAAIYSPMRRLRANMGLAAEMRNDEVEGLDPVLMEMSDLVRAFGQMNTKLLKARPFLPQSLLAAESMEEDENTGGDDNGEGGDDVSTQKGTHRTRQSTLSTASHANRTRMDTLSTHSSVRLGKRSKAGTGTGTGGGNGPSGSGLVKQRAMEVRRVGVLSVNVNGFQFATTTLGLSATARTQAAMTRLVEQCVGEERGIVDYFHGDRFVCGFNTARMCGNVGASAGQASVKLWERFRSDAALSATFPAGLSMGLSTGRAAVGNHGSDSMQRLGTLGYVFTEAMRLQEAMSRRVLASTTCPSGASSSLRDCLGGRCLVMGRTLQDVDTALSFQVLGALPAAELMSAYEALNPSSVSAYANLKNAQVFKVCTNACICPNLGSSGVEGISATFGHNASDSENPLANLDSKGAATKIPATFPAAAASAHPLLVAVLTGTLSSGEGPLGVRNGPSAAGGDEWLYELDATRNINAFKETNHLLCRLFMGKRGLSSVIESPNPLLPAGSAAPLLMSSNQVASSNAVVETTVYSSSSNNVPMGSNFHGPLRSNSNVNSSSNDNINNRGYSSGGGGGGGSFVPIRAIAGGAAAATTTAFAAVDKGCDNQLGLFSRCLVDNWKAYLRAKCACVDAVVPMQGAAMGAATADVRFIIPTPEVIAQLMI